MDNESIIPAKLRRYLYPVLLAVVALLGGYGIIADSMAPLWGALAAALLGTGTATAYRPSTSSKHRKIGD